ncbi:hypothetical protein [Photorhabdus viridis]|uniref:hypothetical protein n=1 Tax=Photorhabdus viridis TaxID=3163327 RepID=UPI003307A85A
MPAMTKGAGLFINNRSVILWRSPRIYWLKDDGGADIKDPAKEKHNHLERVECCYEKITWTDQV